MFGQHVSGSSANLLFQQAEDGEVITQYSQSACEAPVRDASSSRDTVSEPIIVKISSFTAAISAAVSLVSHSDIEHGIFRRIVHCPLPDSLDLRKYLQLTCRLVGVLSNAPQYWQVSGNSWVPGDLITSRSGLIRRHAPIPKSTLK